MREKEADLRGNVGAQQMLMKENYFFKPKKSLGWLSLLILIILFAFFTWVSFISYRITEGVGAFFSVVLFIGLAIGGILMLVWFFSMKYELAGDRLILHFGPFNYTIDLYLVENVESKSLFPTLGVGVMVPGFAKWFNSYKDEGKVFMCSTRAMKDIILITTGNGKIGISPAHEAEFIEEINKRIQFVKLLESE